MLNTGKRALKFMRPRERFKFFAFLSIRALVATFDLVGILAIGFLATSMALFITQGSDPSRTFEVGSFSIPAVSAASLPVIASLILALFVGKAILSILLTRQLAFFLARIEARSARVIARNAFGRGLEKARLNSREEILFAVQTGSPSAFNSFLNSVGTLVAESFLFVLILVAFAAVNPIVALGAVAYFGLIGFLIQFFIGRLMHITGTRIAETTVEANSGIADLGEVLRESTILGRQDYFLDKIYNSRLRASGSNASQFVLTGMPRYIVETALIVAIALFIVWQAASGDIATSAATIGIFLSGGLRLTASLLPLQSAMLVIRQSIPAANRALDLLDKNTQQVIDEPDTRKPPKSLKAPNPIHVSLKDVDFRYAASKENTLSSISIEIPAGSQVAFIGVSGAGKSTLADLILGLLSPSSGQVLIDGLEAKAVVNDRPGLLGYVPQKPGMISGTIAQNIALGVSETEIDSERLIKATLDSNLEVLIDSLPEGINTNLGKRRDELSGGQLQRIGLARALYTQPGLLVMDEATSALDAESENEINKALDAMRGEVTVVLIAHRLNTIQRSDIVFLVEDGKISASGTFPELLKTNSTVRNLAQLMAIDSVENDS